MIPAAAGALEHFVMHRCPASGQVYGEPLPAGRDPSCTAAGCGAGCLPDQPYRDGHAWIFCPDCRTLVGICGAAAAADVADQATAALKP
jgi:hypothetical protein